LSRHVAQRRLRGENVLAHAPQRLAARAQVGALGAEFRVGGACGRVVHRDHLFVP
jgi:hypothetical protein